MPKLPQWKTNEGKETYRKMLLTHIARLQRKQYRSTYELVKLGQLTAELKKLDEPSE
jgi:hypothetical protein